MNDIIPLTIEAMFGGIATVPDMQTIRAAAHAPIIPPPPGPSGAPGPSNRGTLVG